MRVKKTVIVSAPAPLPAQGIALEASLLFLMALAIRLACLWQIQKTSLAHPSLTVDGDIYLKLASEISRGNFFAPESAYFGALYPFFLSAIQSIGGNLTAVKISQTVLDSFIPVMLYLASIRLSLGRPVARLAAAAYAFYGIAVLYSVLILDTSLMIFATTAAWWILAEAWKSPRKKTWFAGGAVAALSFLFKPFLFLWVNGLVLAILSRRDMTRQQKTSGVTWLLVGISLTLLPFSLRNHAIEGTSSPFPAYGGFSFYMGNSSESSGLHNKITGVADVPVREIQESVALAQRRTGQSLTPAQASRYWFGQGVHFIRQEPMRFLRLVTRKVCFFWDAREIGNNLDFEDSVKLAPRLRWAFMNFGLVAPWALLGIYFGFRKAGAARLLSGLVLSYMATLALLSISDRYRLPCAPPIIILASYGIWECGQILKYRKHQIPLAFALLAAAFLWVHGPALKEQKTKTGNAYQAGIQFNRGVVQEKMGRPDLAMSNYLEAIRLFPYHSGAHNNLGILYEESSHPQEAQEQYRLALRYEPSNADAHNNLGILLDKNGIYDEAVREFEEAVRINPRSYDAYNNLGAVYSRQNRNAKAAEAYRKALEIKPDFTPAQKNLSLLKENPPE